MSHPDHGHVIPNVAVVTELVDRGHRVTYLTGAQTASIAESAGATVLRYDSRYKRADFTSVANDPRYLLNLLLDESTEMLRTADNELGADRPDLVVYDTSILYAGRILARKWQLPAVQLIPMFASNESFSYLSAIYSGDGAPAAGGPPSPPPWLAEIMGRIGALSASHGVRVAPQELWWGVQDLSLVNIPREFQYAGDTFDDRFVFVGPCVGRRDFLGDWKPPTDELPVVLISLGAVFNGHPDFFRTCVEAFTGAPWHAVMTVADGIDPDELGPLPSNVEVHRWVPHLTVLEHASVAVTHGGMGTVMEALLSGTPMVVVPTSAIDAVTARRLDELDLGRTLGQQELTARRLLELIAEVTASPAIQDATRRMRQHVQAAGGARRAADELENHLARQRT
ncbi:glycosyltransferase [Solwaraspora sp. WMMD406]|uniref:macrolide family glycosyltransferase n=1 Tax=Solwaraspora sp. WMMD406 TaxID=3016095 RepID=UPI002416DF5F|nr:macrolide family glycosyltransferase [Solwaraspora sp. WMMD406]MDG4765614.1 glycosyltransferase [Solwaraspora sp. WMMD406]